MDVINNTWMVVVESISLIRSSTVSKGLTLTSETFRSSSEYDGNVLAFLPRSRVDTKAIYGQRLTIKQTTRDTVGIPAKLPLDQLRAVQLSIKTDEGQPPELLDEYVVCLTVYKSK